MKSRITASVRPGASGMTACAIGESLEMRRQGGRDVGLAFDRVHRIVFTVEHQGRTLDAAKARQRVERVALAAGRPPGGCSFMLMNESALAEAGCLFRSEY